MYTRELPLVRFPFFGNAPSNGSSRGAYLKDDASRVPHEVFGLGERMSSFQGLVHSRFYEAE